MSKSSSETVTELLELVSDGAIDRDNLIQLMIQWMGDEMVSEMVNGCPDFEGLGIQDDDEEEDSEESEYDDVRLINIVWDADDLSEEEREKLPRATELSLVNELLTSGSDYSDDELADWLEEKFLMPAISFDVITD